MRDKKKFAGYLSNAFLLTTLSIDLLIYAPMTICKVAAVGFIILTVPIVSVHSVVLSTVEPVICSSWDAHG